MVFIGTAMDLRTSTSFYLKLFYYLGLSPYHPEEQRGLHAKLAACIKFIQAAIFITAGILSVYYLNAHDVLTNTEKIIINFLVSCDLIRTICNLLQCLCFKQHLIEAMNILDYLDLYFASQLRHRIQYQSFIKGFGWKFAAMLICFILFLATFAMRWALNESLSTASCIQKGMQLMAMINYSHIIFYIAALSFHMKQLNLVVESDLRSCHDLSNPSTLILLQDRLKAFKNVHFRLWMTLQRINRFFGISLAPTVLYSFTAIIYSVYWIFQSFYDRIFSIWRNE